MYCDARNLQTFITDSTILAATATVERSFSNLKRIKTYSRSTQGQEILSGLAVLSIEKELL